MRVQVIVEGEAPVWAHDLARQIEQAFDRIRQDEQAKQIAALEARVKALETP